MRVKHDFYTNAIGRFVSGSMTDKRTKDTNGRPIEEAKQKFEFGIAFPKSDPDMARLFGEFNAFIGAQWAADPQKTQALANWFQTMQGVPMKISDGDKPNNKGQVNENTAGCFVFWFSSTYPIKCCDPANQEIPAESIKRGYYVQVAGNIADNGLAWQVDGKGAGIYMNPSVVRLVAEGEIIAGGVDAATAFGGTQAPVGALPPGAMPLGTAVTAAPAAPATAMPAAAPAAAPVAAPAAAPAAAVPGMPVQQAAPAAAPAAPAAAPAPHPTILNQPAAQPATAAVPAAAPAAAPAAVPGMPGTGLPTGLPGT